MSGTRLKSQPQQIVRSQSENKNPAHKSDQPAKRYQVPPNTPVSVTPAAEMKSIKSASDLIFSIDLQASSTPVPLTEEEKKSCQFHPMLERELQERTPPRQLGLFASSPALHLEESILMRRRRFE